MTVAALTTAGVFLAFVEQVLAPARRHRPGARVVLDNLAPPRAALPSTRRSGPPASRRACGRAARPTEPCWSKIKTRLRTRQARSLDDLDREPPAVRAAVTPEHARGGFRLGGYPAPD
jgi:hypothetical protein